MDGHKGPYIFQSTLPIQGETLQIPKNKFLITFQSTLPIQGETTANCILLITVEISIHSPYTGRDSYTICLENAIEISIHSPYTGRDMVFFPFTIRVAYFNPLSLYRERRWKSTQKWDDGNISIHSPYTGRDIATWKPPFKIEISIHSPYTGRDVCRECYEKIFERFQSTLPIQGETVHYFCKVGNACIFQSTLPIQGETIAFQPQGKQILYFNPLSLYRERLKTGYMKVTERGFQSTLPIQGETRWWNDKKADREDFNPLSLYRERRYTQDRSVYKVHFNPLSLYRERRCSMRWGMRKRLFQSTLPIQGETECGASFALLHNVFQSTLPIQGETTKITEPRVLVWFQSTLPIQGETSSLSYDLQGAAFQSTLPIQGETVLKLIGIFIREHFNPLSLYRERRDDPDEGGEGEGISIHSPYTGRDQLFLASDLLSKLFQSTLPIQGETHHTGD